MKNFARKKCESVSLNHDKNGQINNDEKKSESHIERHRQNKGK